MTTTTKLRRYGLDDTSPNQIMWKLKNQCYGADIDYPEYESPEEVQAQLQNLQYEYPGNGDPKTVCIIDWKHFHTRCISYNSEKMKEANSLKYFRGLANREGVPFFIGICYTKPEDGYGEGQPNPAMFCLVPGNKLANKALKGKTWFTPREMGELMVSLRKHTSVYNPDFSHMQHDPKRYKLECEIDRDSLTANWKNEP